MGIAEGLSGPSQDLKVTTASDGPAIHYATFSQGPPLVIAANWLNHLGFDRSSPVCLHWWEELSRERQVIRYDQRGCGLSHRNTSDLSFEASVGDLGSLVVALGIDRFDLLGASQGGSVAIEYVARHPEKVRHLALYGACVYGWAYQSEEHKMGGGGNPCSVSPKTAGGKTMPPTSKRSSPNSSPEPPPSKNIASSVCRKRPLLRKTRRRSKRSGAKLTFANDWDR